MLDAVLELIPGARVGHLGLQRDETTAVASQYYSKLPSRSRRRATCSMIDPMLATGGSAVAGLDLLYRAPAPATCASRASWLRPRASPSSSGTTPDVHIYTPVVDEGLNAHKFIVPGLGDFGDRLYGTL